MLANARTASRADHGQLDPALPFFMDRRAMILDLTGVIAEASFVSSTAHGTRAVRPRSRMQAPFTIASWHVLASARARVSLGVFIVLAFDSLPLPFEAAVRASEERLGQYTLLRRLPAGLRAEVWLGLPPGGASLGQLVAIKAFFPHAPGPARTALSAELALTSRLGHPNRSHPNILQTLHVGGDAERPFIVSEYIEGTTLRALLRRVNVARARVATSVVTRLLLGVVRAVNHAGRQAASPAAQRLVQQTVAADDVFVTFDGAVKLLGFKGRLASAEHGPSGGEAPGEGANAPAAIDALLSEHLTAALREVLAAGCQPPEPSRRHGLRCIEQGLERWQSEVLGSDGRAELAALMGAMFPSARLELRAQLEARLEQWLAVRSGGLPFAADGDEGVPASGFRAVAPSAR
jgi:hypothetical protein